MQIWRGWEQHSLKQKQLDHDEKLIEFMKNYCIKLFWLKTKVERIEKTLKVVLQIAQQNIKKGRNPYQSRAFWTGKDKYEIRYRRAPKCRKEYLV